MPNPPPSDCTECEVKIILNGDVSARVLEATCERIEAFVASGREFPRAQKLVEMANSIENDVFKFQREVLEQIGFRGPWPDSLKKKHED